MRKPFHNKKATMILLLGVIGLMIGVGTFFGVKYFQQTEQEQLFIGEKQLQILAQDKNLAAERFFVQHAAPFAVSSAIFTLGQKGGHTIDLGCGFVEGHAVWIKNKTQPCLPDNTTMYALARQVEETIKPYLQPIDAPDEYVVTIQHNELLGTGKIFGKAEKLSVHDIMDGKLAGNLSFVTELRYDLADYLLLGTVVQELWDGIPDCIHNKDRNECVGKGIKEANEKQALKKRQLTLHYENCHFDTSTEEQKLGQHTNKQYVLCALRNDGRTFIAYDSDKGVVEERELEYWLSIDFG